MHGAALAVLSVAKATSFVESTIREQLGVTVRADCGKGLVAVRDVGATLDCQAVATDGTSRKAVLTVTDVDGSVDMKLA